QTDMKTSIGGVSPAPPLPPPPPEDSEPPSAPSNLSVTSATTTTSIGLAWNASTDNVGVAGYNVFLNGIKVWSPFGTSYTYLGLTCGTPYTVAVEAYDAAGNLSSRPSITTSTLACAPSPPPPPPPPPHSLPPPPPHPLPPARPCPRLRWRLLPRPRRLLRLRRLLFLLRLRRRPRPRPRLAALRRFSRWTGGLATTRSSNTRCHRTNSRLVFGSPVFHNRAASTWTSTLA